MTKQEIIQELAQTSIWDTRKLYDLIRAAQQVMKQDRPVQERLLELLEFSCQKYGVTVEQARSKSRALLPNLCRIDYIQRAYRETPCKSHEIGAIINRTGSTVRSHLYNSHTEAT